MTTINYTAEHDAIAGCVKVEWPGLSAGDVGQAFASAGLKIASIHYHGSFGGGAGEVQATNELSPGAYSSIDSANSPRINLPTVNSAASLLSVGHIRPSFPSGSGSLNVSIVFLSR